jgi:hypothetical protein
MDSSCESTRGSSQNFWMGPPRSRGSSVPAIALISEKKIAYFLTAKKFPVLMQIRIQIRLSIQMAIQIRLRIRILPISFTHMMKN